MDNSSSMETLGTPPRTIEILDNLKAVFFVILLVGMLGTKATLNKFEVEKSNFSLPWVTQLYALL